jgi:hypothetical protein
MKVQVYLLMLVCVVGCANVEDIAPPTHKRGDAGTEASKERERLEAIVSRYRFLAETQGPNRDFLEQLAKKGDFSALRAICQSDAPFNEFAAEHAVWALSPDAAIRFCRELIPGSHTWVAAVLALNRFPKTQVIGYIREMVTQDDPFIRYACYKLCSMNKWDDLAYYAEKDVNNNSFIGIPNNPKEAFLGYVAINYLWALGRVQEPVTDRPQRFLDKYAPTRAGVGEHDPE